MSTLEETRAWVAAMIASPPAVSEDFVVVHEGRVVGKAGFYRLPEIGFILRPDLWGRGLAIEAVRAVVEHVLRTREVSTLRADVDPRNTASLALLERLGFERTGTASGTYCIAGVWTDSVYLELKNPNAPTRQGERKRS